MEILVPECGNTGPWMWKYKSLDVLNCVRKCCRKSYGHFWEKLKFTAVCQDKTIAFQKLSFFIDKMHQMKTREDKQYKVDFAKMKRNTLYVTCELWFLVFHRLYCPHRSNKPYLREAIKKKSHRRGGMSQPTYLVTFLGKTKLCFGEEIIVFIKNIQIFFN